MSDDNSSFTSLMDLVDSHLSKTSLQASNSANPSHLSIPLPNLLQKGLSDTLLNPPNKIIPLPRFEVKNNAITDVLALQVTNMLIAKEKKKEEEEKQRLEEEMKKLKLQEQEDPYLIDLMPAIIRNSDQKPVIKKEVPVLSNSSSFESLFTEFNKEMELDKPLDKPKMDELPINTDMSYILFQKIKKGKCSQFGKVLTSRLRPVAAPYLKTEIHNPNIVRFDFSTKSPCDILKEKRLHPPVDPYAHMNMVMRFNAQSGVDI